MKKFESILVDYFGATQPVFDDKTGGLTTSGKEAYQKLNKLVNELDAIKVLDKSYSLEVLKEIVEAHIIVTSTNIASDLAALRLALIGKSLYTYDSWNGSSMSIEIDGIEVLSDSILCTGKNFWGNRSGIYIDKSCLEELIATKKAIRHRTIDHCDVTTSWILNNKSNK